MRLRVALCLACVLSLALASIDEGIALQRQRKFTEAVEKYKPHRKSPNVNTLIGQCFAMQSKYDDALRYFRAAVKMDESDVVATSMMATTLKFHATEQTDHSEGSLYMKELNDATVYWELFREHMLHGAGKTGRPQETFWLSEAFFWNHFGETYLWLNRRDDAYSLAFVPAAERGIFPHPDQRPANVYPNLESQPFWEADHPAFARINEIMTEAFPAMRAEAVAALDGRGFALEKVLHDSQSWKELFFFGENLRQHGTCDRSPTTCAVLQKIPETLRNPEGQLKFSLMEPGTHVKPHCGGSNKKIRMHLGLVVPEGCCEIRVANETRSWKEGELLIFDDSFEHEVWHTGSENRLVLIMDVIHPYLPLDTKKSLLRGLTPEESKLLDDMEPEIQAFREKEARKQSKKSKKARKGPKKSKSKKRGSKRKTANKQEL